MNGSSEQLPRKIIDADDIPRHGSVDAGTPASPVPSYELPPDIHSNGIYYAPTKNGGIEPVIIVREYTDPDGTAMLEVRGVAATTDGQYRYKTVPRRVFEDFQNKQRRSRSSGGGVLATAGVSAPAIEPVSHGVDTDQTSPNTEFEDRKIRH